MKSVTKNQKTTVEMSAMNGNRQRAWATRAARRIRNSSERCARDQTPNAEPPQPFSQPNQLQADPTKKPQAITVAKAKMPAATHVPTRHSTPARNKSTKKMRNAQAVRAPPPYCVERYPMAEMPP